MKLLTSGHMITLEHWKHYVEHERGNGWWHLFSVSDCEACGATVIEPNSMQVRVAESVLREHGLTKREMPTNEIEPTEDGDCVCSLCRNDS